MFLFVCGLSGDFNLVIHPRDGGCLSLTIQVSAVVFLVVCLTFLKHYLLLRLSIAAVVLLQMGYGVTIFMWDVKRKRIEKPFK